jgi:uncharacterized protein
MRLRAQIQSVCCIAALACSWSTLAAGAKTLRPALALPGAPVATKLPILAKPVTPRPAAAVADATISIMTEALSATAGGDEDSIGELARAYAGAGLARILPVRGLGPIANMRDLLHMRGIDMAVVNADILAYARLTGDLRGVDSRLSAVAKLHDKTVYLVAASGVTAIGDLANQRVLVPGADSDSYVTARALFGELAIPADVVGASLGEAIGEIGSGKAKALLLTLEQDDETLATLPPDKGLHILPVPDAAALTRTYGRRTVLPGGTSGLAPADGASTLTVASLLATFNWRPTHVRFAPVLQFIRGLPRVVEQLRTTDAKGVWRAFDGRAEVQDWLRYEPARPLLATILPQTAPLTAPVATAKANAQTSAPATSSALSTKPAPLPEPAPPIAVAVAAYATTALTSETDAKGGLLAEIVKGGLKANAASLEWLPNEAGTLTWLADGKTARIAFPFTKPDCDHAPDLSAASAALCNRYAFSKPIFQTLEVLFVRHGSDITFERDEQLVGRSICAPSGSDTSSLDGAGRHWLKEDLVTLLLRPSLAACFAALDHGDVDAVLTDDLGGRAALNQLGVADRIEVARRPVATMDICAIAAKDNADGVIALSRLDVGVAALKADGHYADIVLGHLGAQQLSGDVPAVQ